MTDRQAAEARARAEVISETERRIDGKLALTAIANPDVMVPTRTLRALVHEAKQVDALSVRLAQAEQERDEALQQRDHDYARFSEAKRGVIDESKSVMAERERAERAEEALWRFTALCGEPGENPLNPDWAEANEQARAVLAASGGREPEKCPRCFGKGLENQDDRPGILLGPLGEMECRECGGTGVASGGREAPDTKEPK